MTIVSEGVVPQTNGEFYAYASDTTDGHGFGFGYDDYGRGLCRSNRRTRLPDW